MKRSLINVMFVAVIGLVAISCDNKETEERIARLEGRVAELEAGNGGNISRPATTNPSTTNPTLPTAVEEEDPGDGPFPTFTWAEEEYDFGNINDGDIVDHVFTFTNSGEAPLIISSATASCGCTVPEWPKDPIPVGATGEIHVKFNSRNKPGIQNKTITVTANTNPKISRLKIKANVAPANPPS